MELPATSRIHPFFHVLQLKVLIGNVPTSTQFPLVISAVLIKKPARILERKMVNRQGKEATMVLVKWSHLLLEEATWEFLFELCKTFPTFEH